jgi:hypothetical protein
MTNKLRAFVTVAVLATLVVTTMVSQASAFFLRVPQVPVLGGGLQAYLNSKGESINVLTDQVDAQVWAPGASGNSVITIMIELAGNAPANAFGLYDTDLAVPPLYQVFPGAAQAGWYAVVSIQVANVIVTLFDENSIIQGQVVYAGVNLDHYGYYISGPGGTFYSQDSRNGGAAQILTYAGTGQNSGEWWICVEDLSLAGGSDQDYDDLVAITESVNPVKTQQVTLGAVKAMYHK